MYRLEPNTSYMSRTGSTNKATRNDMMLVHDDIEYMGTLQSVSYDLTKLRPVRAIHEQDSNDISLQQWLAVVLADALLATLFTKLRENIRTSAAILI